ncbi:type 1 glutamine amidotransferase domain-containing protein [Fructilactobacillus myrtifloralis]|uniref:Type 1 glutamine amidotransferase domain-containing protein n=1 Tax=Fructilactobacillus myrtifloralis TaxID=2940301 RepID=A0ABY5BMY3_9LACO|nr:type 1 glutamine amidotransferase domain-containing protein [Fructilactobacillus myrtifloralis]USS85033.1 type 1 glutamine amidotransferase domain-containing protein [Fructilactobacillus myrtifloralis]
MTKKILVVETNVANFAGTNHLTGLWLGESAEFVATVQAAGLAVDYVSPNGGYVPLDPRSMKPNYVDDNTLRTYLTHDYQTRALANTLKTNQVNPDDYVALYFTGGHGVMFDFPNNLELQALVKTVYGNGGYLCTVCHGIAGLLNVKLADGNYLIAGKKVTGFTTSEELLSGNSKRVPFLNEKVATSHGAQFVKERPFKSFAVQDGQLITGQNPASPQAVADQLLTNLQA